MAENVPNLYDMAPYYLQMQAYTDRVQQVTGHRPRAFVHTYGCQQNVADGERLSGMLAEMGYTFTDTADTADFILLNTCAIRQSAQDRVLGNVGAMKKLKEQNPALLIGLCGCMTQQPSVAALIQKSYPQVDLVFGTYAADQLPRLLCEALEGRRVFELSEREHSPEGLPVWRGSRFKAWVPIMRGCDNFCSYCIVPYVRGRERSRQPASIIEEVAALVKNGYREITLLGQNVNSYGKNLAEPVSFAQLLRQIDALPGDFWVRFMTSHPKDCTRELIDAIADSRKVCRHIHLPVQSGSDAILGQMNRRYTVEQYRSIVDYARQRIPGVSFTSDIIVGFPGEQYDDFLKTVELVRQVRYHSLFTFIYSPREGTRAAALPDPVPYREKSRWLRELLAVQEPIGEEICHGMVGASCRVLAEDVCDRNSAHLIGHTESGLLVEFAAGPERVGQFVQLTITGATNRSLIGRLP